MRKIDNFELLISIIGLKGGKLGGRVRIQKLLCLLKYESRLPVGFKFRSYLYGPYADEVTSTINVLVGMKVLRENMIQLDYDHFMYDYELTDEGQKLFKRIEARLGKSNPSFLRRLTGDLRSFDKLSTPNLILRAKRASKLESI